LHPHPSGHLVCDLTRHRDPDTRELPRALELRPGDLELGEFFLAATGLDRLQEDAAVLVLSRSAAGQSQDETRCRGQGQYLTHGQTSFDAPEFTIPSVPAPSQGKMPATRRYPTSFRKKRKEEGRRREEDRFLP